MITAKVIQKTPGAVSVQAVPDDVLQHVAEAFAELSKDVNRNGAQRWSNYIQYDANAEGNEYTVGQFIKYVKAAAMSLPTAMVAAFRTSLDTGGAPVEGVTHYRLFPFEDENTKELKRVQAELKRREREAAGKGTPGRKGTAAK